MKIMKKGKFILFGLIMCFGAILPLMAVDIGLSSSGSGLRVITHEDVGDYFGRGLPMGPASLRFFNDRIWVVDSIEGKFAEFSSDGKALKTINVDDGKKFVFADFAFQANSAGVLEAFWAIGSEETQIVKIGLDGKKLAVFASNLSMPAQIELIDKKMLVIYDEALQGLVAFDLQGRELWRKPTVGKGFVVTADNHLIFCAKHGDELVLQQKNPFTGAEKKLRNFPVSQDSQLRLLAIQKNGDLIFSFHIQNEIDATYSFILATISLRTTDEMKTLAADFPAPFLNRIVLTHQDQLLKIDFIEKSGKKLLRLSDFMPEFSYELSEG
jgi:hypothetical protein